MSFNSSPSRTSSVTGNEVPIVGYRFHPTDRELIIDYLGPKIRGQHDHDHVIADVEVCKIEPWDLPVWSMINSNDQVWYFFCPRQHKYKKSNRCNRKTKKGYWKSDGKVRPIRAKCTKEVIGSKRSLIFHLGQYSSGKRTKWVMHEYECTPDSGLSKQGNFVLCKLKNKSDVKATKHDAYHQMTLNHVIESQESIEMASIASHGICESSHLMYSDSYNKNQDLCVIRAMGELVDVNDTTEVVIHKKLLQSPTRTLQTSNIQNSGTLLAINTSLCPYQNSNIAEVAFTQQSFLTPKTTLQTSNIQIFDSLPAINTSQCHYQNNDITKGTSFDPKTQVNAYFRTCSSISPSETAILSGTVVDSSHDIGKTDSLVVSDIGNHNSDNQNGISSASVEVEWSPSMAESSNDYEYVELEGNPEFSAEFWAWLALMLE